MGSQIKVLRTNEIDDETWKQIAHGYEVCFGIKKNITELKESFTRSITGYTLHAIKYNEDGVLIGHNYYQPRPYVLNGQKIICALSGGTFVLPEFRSDIFVFNEMVRALDKESAKLGWKALLGVPNENSFKYAVKINKQKHIGDLSYYILPIHAGKVLNKKSRLLDILSSLYSSTTLILNRLLYSFWNRKEKTKNLYIDLSDGYLDLRFDWNKYKRIKSSNLQGVYRLFDEHGVKTAYITYFAEGNRRSNKSLYHIVHAIKKHENVDAIIYIGTMNFPQFMLTKVPPKYVPQQLPLCVTILDKNDSEIKEATESLDCIDFGLINFDVR